jgi:hypothetical protein
VSIEDTVSQSCKFWGFIVDRVKEGIKHRHYKITTTIYVYLI